MSLDILFDFAYRKVFFLVLKAPLKYGNLMFYFVLLFITQVIISILLMIIYQKSHCINI